MSSVGCYRLKKSRAVMVRSDGEIHEHEGVTCVFVCPPCAVGSQLTKCAGNPFGIASAVEAHRLQNSGHDVAHVSGNDIAAGIRDSFAPLIDVSWSECFPVHLKNTYTGFPLVDIFAVTKCDFHVCSLDRGQLGT